MVAGNLYSEIRVKITLSFFPLKTNRNFLVLNCYKLQRKVTYFSLFLEFIGTLTNLLTVQVLTCYPNIYFVDNKQICGSVKFSEILKKVTNKH